MRRNVGVLLIYFLCFPAAARPQKGNADSPPLDHSQEAFVIEKFSSKQKFEDDGTSSREDSARVHIQSEAGVQTYGLLSFSYASATGTFEIPYVRVRKPDGSIIETPPENVQDMTAQITREAPFYSDLHEKHVTVKGLNVGDVLEFQILEHTTKPLAAGQFWTSYDFSDSQIVLDEELEIEVPRNRQVKVKSPTVQPVIAETGAYRSYTWHHSNLQHKDDANQKREATTQAWQVARGRLPQPDVLVSSFASWADVGKWYGVLQEERVKPTPEVTAKAAELTKGAAGDEAKIRALYAYVSTQFHYIGVAFGIGRYQPHSAEVVLENQYGDCKDKHTLLASLLAATGIPAYPALISSHREIDSDVPSPGQFDHVITVVPRADGVIWIDTTSEVGPFEYLVMPLRDKHALAVWKDQPAALISTPADPPYESVQTFNMDAKLSDTGTLEGTTEFTVRGDLEYLFRAGFRSLPVTQWKDLAQRISLGFGFGGEVSSVTATSPEKTDEAFHLSYKYTRREFGDWPNRRILAPEPVIALPASADEDSLPLGPIWLGTLTEVRFHSQLELPPGNQPLLPPDVHFKEDFAQFDATYQYKDGKLIAERHFKVLMREVPSNEREQFKQLVKAMQGDYGVFIPLAHGIEAQAQNGPSSSMNDLRNLPNSANDEALRLEDEARQAVIGHDVPNAISSLYRAVAADPKFTRAWVMLGSLLISQKQIDAGIEAFHKGMATAPEEPIIPKALGWTLMAENHLEEAVTAWKDYTKAHPEDVDGSSNLAVCLTGLKKYSEAVVAYESAMKSGGDKPGLQAGLASALLLGGDREKAGAAFAKLAELDPAGRSYNNAAYEMANADLELPLALEYSTKATRGIEEGTQKIGLSDLTTEDLGKIFSLAAYWDTLGWINERMSNFAAAESYLRASWNLTQGGVPAEHLCDLYRRTHEVAKAIRMCRLALFRMPTTGGGPPWQSADSLSAASQNLKLLTHGAADSRSTDDSSDIVIRERRFDLPRFLPGTESAEFFVLLEAVGKGKTFKVADVRFINGSDKMKNEGKRLKDIDFKVSAPDDIPVRFVRRGILGCYQYSGCSFVLLDPASVRSVD